MKVGTTLWKRRKAWELDNDAVRVVVVRGGGNIACITHRDRPRINPLWDPVWKPVEPWNFKASKHARLVDSRLLGCICGHNLCLGWFGGASPDETKLGLGGHGEAPVARWKLLARRVTSRGVMLSVGCDLPATGMRVRRTITAGRGSCVVRVRETVENTLRRDLPYTMCEHVTYGPPFLEKGATTFDMSATKGHTYPGVFEPAQRMKSGTAFTWPNGPRKGGGTVNLRMIERKDRVSSDFSTQLMDKSREDAWFAAVNPRIGLLSAYCWKRADFPWTGNWEENYGRKTAPWAGKSLTRGMEFTNAPFPTGLRAAVELGRFHGLPTFRWLPARGKVTVSYSIITAPVPAGTKGVADIKPAGREYEVDLIKA